MNLFKILNEKIHLDKIEEFDGDVYELALVRYVMKEISKLFYRDYTFFFNKENINERSSIYNRDIDITNIQDFSIVCKSYCNIIKMILNNNYGIDVELISAFDDSFRHVDLLIKTKQGNNYIVDPLTDMIEMQVGLRTNHFASEKYYNSLYAKSKENISFLSDKTLEKIDDKIDYKNDGIYLDDFLKHLRTKFDNIEELLQENEKVAIKLLGYKYNGEKLSEDKKITFKLKFISNFLNNRKYLNGTVDLLMFANTVIQILFTDEEQKKIHLRSFFVDNIDLKNEDLKNIFSNKESRKRGIVISFNGDNYVFSLSPISLQYSDTEWKKIVKDNNIFIRPKYQVQLLKYLVANGVDRNIVHNNEFLKLFSIFENKLLSTNKTLDDIIANNIYIQDGIIYSIIDGNTTSYRIENGNLIIKEHSRNTKHTVLYQDEGRNISYITQPILKENEMLHLYEFDSNGLFDLDDALGIEEMVAPLNNGKYLSRNKSFYEAKSYTELACERKRLSQILTDDVSKKNFVILEYLANSSAKVYFEELKKKVDNQENKTIEAKKCFEEDCTNIVRFFNNEPLKIPIYDLPYGDSKILDRHIEMDNKQILYIFCSNLKFSNPKHILTPGLGSIFVGPMLKSMYGFDYTNILFSLYSKDEKLRNISEQKSFEETLSNDEWKKTGRELVLIDDNVGSGNTMNTIIRQLNERDKQCKFGAIKYNWNFYSQVKRGELDHPTFNTNEVDFLTILDDPGYWIMRDSIKALKEENGDAYIKVMKEYGLRKDDTADIEILMNLAEKYSTDAGIDLYNIQNEKIKKSSAFLCVKLKKQIEEIIRDIPSQNRGIDE